MVLSGWRAWLFMGLMGVAAAVVLTAIAFLLFGITVTLAVILLFVVPLAIIVALVADVVRRLGQR